jgi:hypothetical protein
MDPLADAADPFIRDLVRRLSGDPRVVGLVLAGSSAETSRRDAWSDHDFLLITEDGTPEGFRTELSWLPDHDGIGFWFRETAHGLKVLYRSGLMVEFAVFDRTEFSGCALNHHRVVIDRGGITELAGQVRQRSVTGHSVDRTATLRLFLSLVYIGSGRAQRGERLSANVFLRDYATAALLRLVTDLLPASDLTPLDGLDPWRRFEQAAPQLATAVDAALSLPVDRVGRALLACAEPFLADRWPEYPAEDLALVRGLLSS